MKTLKDFIAEVADAKTVITLHTVALEIAETTFFGKEQNERLRAWVAEGKNPRAFKTHLVNMLQIAERSSRIEITSDLAEKAEAAGDKNFFPPKSATTQLQDLPESEQQKMYKAAVIEGLPHTIDVFTRSTLDQITLYKVLEEENSKLVTMPEDKKKVVLAKKAKLKQTVSEKVHALIELLQNQVHVDIAKSSRLWGIYTEKRQKEFAEIQDFLNEEEMGNLQLVYELYRFAIKSDPAVNDYFLSEEVKAAVLNEKLEPSPISSEALTWLFKVRHPNLAKFTDPNVKYKIIDEDRLNVRKLAETHKLYGKEFLLAVLRNISPNTIIGLITAASRYVDAYNSLSSEFMTIVFSFTSIEEGERVVREKVSSKNQTFFTLCHVLSELDLEADVWPHMNLEVQTSEIFSLLLDQADASIEAFRKGKKTTKDVVVSVERLLKLFRIASEYRIPLPLDKIARLQNIQQFLDAQKDSNGQSAGAKLPVLNNFGRAVVRGILNQIHCEDLQITFRILFSPSTSFIDVEFAKLFPESLLRGFLQPNLPSSGRGDYNLTLVKMAFFFRHCDLEKLRIYVRTASLPVNSYKNLFLFAAENNLNELLSDLLENQRVRTIGSTMIQAVASYLSTTQFELIDSRLVLNLVNRFTTDERQRLFNNHDVLTEVFKLKHTKLALEIIKLMKPKHLNFKHLKLAVGCGDVMLEVTKAIINKLPRSKIDWSDYRNFLEYATTNNNSKIAILMVNTLVKSDFNQEPDMLQTVVSAGNLPGVAESVYKKLSEVLFKAIEEGDDDLAIGIVKHLPRYCLFTPIDGSTPLDCASKYERRDVADTIIEKLTSGTDLERVLSSRRNVRPPAASTAIGQTSGATNANVSVRTHPMDSIDPMGIMQSRSSDCSIV